MTMGMMRLLLSFVVLLTTASAFANVPRHERVEMKEIKKGGEVVGFSLKMVLRTEHQTYVVARPGIAPAGQRAASFRTAAPGIDNSGHMLAHFDDVTVARNEPMAVEYKILFKDHPKLKPGTPIEIVTAWNTTAKNGTWHVYGMTSNLTANPDKYIVPGQAAAPAAQRKTKVSAIKRAGRRTQASQQRAKHQTPRASRPKSAKPARAR